MPKDEITENFFELTSTPCKLARRLLAMDDDGPVAQVIREIATSEGFTVRVVTQSGDFRTAYSEFAPDVITLDLLMPDVDGFEILALLRDLRCPAQIILLSGAAENYLRMAYELASVSGLRIGGVLAKPTQIGELYQLLAQ